MASSHVPGSSPLQKDQAVGSGSATRSLAKSPAVVATSSGFPVRHNLPQIPTVMQHSARVAVSKSSAKQQQDSAAESSTINVVPVGELEKEPPRPEPIRKSPRMSRSSAEGLQQPSSTLTPTSDAPVNHSPKESKKSKGPSSTKTESTLAPPSDGSAVKSSPKESKKCKGPTLKVEPVSKERKSSEVQSLPVSEGTGTLMSPKSDRSSQPIPIKLRIRRSVQEDGTSQRTSILDPVTAAPALSVATSEVKPFSVPSPASQQPHSPATPGCSTTAVPQGVERPKLGRTKTKGDIKKQLMEKRGKKRLEGQAQSPASVTVPQTDIQEHLPPRKDLQPIPAMVRTTVLV